jgi:hypothetical protein
MHKDKGNAPPVNPFPPPPIIYCAHPACTAQLVNGRCPHGHTQHLKGDDGGN